MTESEKARSKRDWLSLLVSSVSIVISAFAFWNARQAAINSTRPLLHVSMEDSNHRSADGDKPVRGLWVKNTGPGVAVIASVKIEYRGYEVKDTDDLKAKLDAALAQGLPGERPARSEPLAQGIPIPPGGERVIYAVVDPANSNVFTLPSFEAELKKVKIGIGYTSTRGDSYLALYAPK